MNNRQILLSLFLDAVGVPPTVTTLDDRKTVQKTVYLGQVAGFDLGYRFGWYLMGPYSPQLTQDYFGLADSLARGDRQYRRWEIEDAHRLRLASVDRISTPPSTVDLGEADWLELLSSYHYLRTVRQLTPNEAIRVLRREKKHLVPYVQPARRALLNAGLLKKKSKKN